MGLYDGLWAAAAERRCQEDAFREGVTRRMEGGEVGVVEPAMAQAETAEAALSTVETGVARNSLGARALAVLARFWPGNGSER